MAGPDRDRRRIVPQSAVCYHPPMAQAADDSVLLWQINALHTTIWAVLAGAVVLIPVAAWTGALRLGLCLA